MFVIRIPRRGLVMDSRYLYSIAFAIIAAATAAISVHVTVAASQTQASGVAMKTPWGDPDLQGIWTEEFDTPFQRPAKYANQEFFTEAQRAELDKRRSALLARLGTDPNLANAYN